MDSHTEILIDSYLSFSDPGDDSGSEEHSFDEYDMFALEDNTDEIVAACPDSDSPDDSQGSFDDITSPVSNPDGDAQPFVGEVISWDSNEVVKTSLCDVIITSEERDHTPGTASLELVRHLSRCSTPGH